MKSSIFDSVVPITVDSDEDEYAVGGSYFLLKLDKGHAGWEVDNFSFAYKEACSA